MPLLRIPLLYLLIGNSDYLVHLYVCEWFSCVDMLIFSYRYRCACARNGGGSPLKYSANHFGTVPAVFLERERGGC